MTIGKKMGVGFSALLALVVTLAVVVLFNLSNMNRQFSFVIEHDAINANASTRVHRRERVSGGGESGGRVKTIRGRELEEATS